MRHKISLFLLFVVSLIADQVSKITIDNTFALYDSKPLIGSVLRLHYIRNAGVAFGMRFGSAPVMLTITVLVTCVLLYLVFSGKFSPSGMVGRVALILVLSGAIGNLIDRFRLGEVIDFIDMGIGTWRWPTYNFADIYVSIGMVMLIVLQLFEKHPGEMDATAGKSADSSDSEVLTESS